MKGLICTYQKCPKCAIKFPSSKGGTPILCKSGCQTQPTKFFLKIHWKGKQEQIFYDRDGRTIHDFGHAMTVIGEIRAAMASHATGKGIFDPNTYKKQSNTSFKAFWDRFHKSYSGATKEKIKTIGKHHLEYFHEFQMRDISAWHIDEWWHQLRGKGLSTRYLNDILTWVKAFFRYAVDLDIIEKMPKRMPNTLKTAAPEVEEWFSEDEQVAILKALPEYDRPIFDFLFLTGCRVNEACALQRSDINFKTERIFIQNTVKRDGSIGVVKNKKKRRLPFTGAIRSCILQALKVSGISNGFVFINKWGRRYSDDYLRDTLNRTCDELEIRRIKLKNATRHSFGMDLVNRGFDAWQVSKIMNHSDIKITEHYIKMIDKDIDKAYDKPGKERVKSNKEADN